MGAERGGEGEPSLLGIHFGGEAKITISTLTNHHGKGEGKKEDSTHD